MKQKKESGISAGRLPTLRWAAGGLLILGLLSRILGLVREILTAGLFGVSSELDALFLGLAIPTAITVAVGGSLVRAGVATAAGLAVEQQCGLARYATDRWLRRGVPLSLGLAVGCVALALLLQNNTETPRMPLVLGALLGSLTLLGVLISGVYAGIANARGQHVGAGLIPLFHNGVIIATMVVLWEPLGVYSLLLGFFLAEWLQIPGYWWAMGKEVRTARPARAREYWSVWMERFVPALVASVLVGTNLVVDRAFAVQLEPGSAAALVYAEKLVNLPAGLLGMALAVPLFTRVSRYRMQGREKDVAAVVMLGVRLMLLGGIPMAVLLWFLAEPLIAVLLQRGAFDGAAVELCAEAFRGLAWGIPFFGTSFLLLSAALTVERPWRVVRWLGLSVVLNAVLNALLVVPFGLAGIGLSGSLVAVFRVLVLLRLVAPGILKTKSLWASLGRIVLGNTPGALLLGLGLPGLEGVMPPGWSGKFLMVMGGGVLFLVGSLVMVPVWRREVVSLGVLRNRVARANRREKSKVPTFEAAENSKDS
ncbi:MAG: lipid II flippase MurJ [Candidatus Sumerlaeia bacterium]|nr:lipid II flippase MurJ [Candidatus Sumerlaeia bacterium]